VFFFGSKSNITGEKGKQQGSMVSNAKNKEMETNSTCAEEWGRLVEKRQVRQNDDSKCCEASTFLLDFFFLFVNAGGKKNMVL